MTAMSLQIISVDDHLLEPPDLWLDRIPSRYADRIPHVERHFGYLQRGGGTETWFDDPEKANPASRWCDHWVYEDMRMPFRAGLAATGLPEEVQALNDSSTPITFDEMRPGCYEQTARLADMDKNQVEASLCFPTMPRFAGQTFAERADKELGLLCLQAYNDFMIDTWCAGAGYGRLIPVTIVPLWDAQLAADEVLRCANKGSHAIAFSEVPPYLGLPSIHSGYWDPLFAACNETKTVISMHIGSGSRLITTSEDASIMVVACLQAQSAQAAFIDWLSSGVLARFEDIKIALSEGQVGWMPYLLERADDIWERGNEYDPDIRKRIPDRPSSYMNRVYGCLFNDLHGLESRDKIGMDQLMFETDYPHADSTFPDSQKTAARLTELARLTEHETWQLLRGNAIRCYDLEQFGICK
jgi:predicted TIM-barrel fold metal-dependent hydrolase